MSSKRGRPEKEDSAREVIPPIRVTKEQKQHYRSAAEEAGMSLSAWLKHLANEASRFQTVELK